MLITEILKTRSRQTGIFGLSCNLGEFRVAPKFGVNTHREFVALSSDKRTVNLCSKCSSSPQLWISPNRVMLRQVPIEYSLGSIRYSMQNHRRRMLFGTLPQLKRLFSFSFQGSLRQAASVFYKAVALHVATKSLFPSNRYAAGNHVTSRLLCTNAFVYRARFSRFCCSCLLYRKHGPSYCNLTDELWLLLFWVGKA